MVVDDTGIAIQKSSHSAFVDSLQPNHPLAEAIY
jgi:hypothetical protein